MKRKICFLGLLCLFFSGVTADGQEVRIGEKVPDVLIQKIRGLTLDGKPVTEARLSAFGGRLLILDFWATWCAPCRRMVPVMDSLQRVFGERVVFLPVTYERAEVVAPVLAAMRKVRDFDLPEVTGDVVLGKLFPHRSLPHYVWIGPDGVVRAVTEEKEVTGENIERLLDGRSAGGMAEKKDVRTAYDPGAPLLLAGNGGDGRSVLFHSVLTGFVPGIGSGLRRTPLDPVRGQLFTARNNTFPWLCRMAYGDHGWFQEAQVRVLSRDSLAMISSLTGQAFEDWLAEGHGYCYELRVPASAAGQAYALMQEDMRRYFPRYRAAVEKRVVRCLALVRLPGRDKLVSAGGAWQTEVTPYRGRLRNSTLGELLMRLRVQYLQNSPLPVVDATGYTGLVDMDLEGRMDDVASLNAALARYGLGFREQDAAVDLLVIRDNDILMTKP